VGSCVDGALGERVVDVRLDGFHCVAGDDGPGGCGVIGWVAEFVPRICIVGVRVTVYRFSVER
jgi:hypothetical protein